VRLANGVEHGEAGPDADPEVLAGGVVPAELDRERRADRGVAVERRGAEQLGADQQLAVE
jgi:hypothetical protein